MELDRKRFSQMLVERDRVLRWIQSQGAVFCTDERERQRAKEVAAAVWSVFPEYLGCVSALYVYRMDQQQCEDLKQADGITWTDVTQDIGTLYAIGLSVEALNVGTDYSVLVFLHELCHVLVDREHSLTFQIRLNELIRKFDQATGRKIENDYYGLPTRFDKKFHTDSRSYNPFTEDIPQETRSAQSRAFRTGGRPISRR